jgi:hypothetical protein
MLTNQVFSPVKFFSLSRMLLDTHTELQRVFLLPNGLGPP